MLDMDENRIFGAREIRDQAPLTFMGPNSAPGRLLQGCTSSSHPNKGIAKKEKYYVDLGDDGIIEVGEDVFFLTVIQVRTPTGDTFLNGCLRYSEVTNHLFVQLITIKCIG